MQIELKKIIREELEKVLSMLNETDFYQSSDNTIISNDKDSIIYDYEKGRIFAGENLEADILNLNRYNLVEYLPKSMNEEMWSFEFSTVHGAILIVDIKRIINSEKSFWSMKFGQLYKGEKNPTLIGTIGNTEGYENFIAVVNKQLSPKIDPSKY